MSSASNNSVYAHPSQLLRYFHSMHRASLAQLVQSAESASTADDANSLGQDISEFAQGLDAHHRIEDATMFPALARKQDISHLEEHHHALEKALESISRLAKSLRRMDEDDFARFDQKGCTEQLKALEKLVNEHEAAEEAVVSVDNLKKLFTPAEMKKEFRM